MTHLNEAEFGDEAFEENLGRAIGLQADGTFSGGMASTTIAEVPMGSVLCRVTHSALPAEVSRTSPWWACKADFALILSRASPPLGDFRDTLRNSLALAEDYAISDDRADSIRARYGRDALATLRNFAGIRPMAAYSRSRHRLRCWLSPALAAMSPTAARTTRSTR